MSPPRRSWALAALLASLSMLAPFAIDAYLPAFPAIGGEFDAAPIAIQQTLSTYLFAYAFMMLWHGALSDALGWRAIFWALLVLVAGVFAWSASSLPETLPPAARQPLHPRALWRSYRAVLLRVDFVLLAFIPALNFAGFFVYIAGAPAFLIDLLGVTTSGFAWLFIPMIAGIMIGAVLSGRFAGRRSPQRTIRLGYALMFAGTAVNLLICGFLPPHVAWNVLPVFIFCVGTSLVMPSATLLLLDLFPAMRGMASSRRRKGIRSSPPCSASHVS